MSDMRYITTRNGPTLHCVLAVPRKLKPILDKSHLLESLHTTDPEIARRKRHAVQAKFQSILAEARRQLAAGEVMGAAAGWRTHIARLKSGHLTHVWDSRYEPGSDDLRQAALCRAQDFVEEEAAEVAATHGAATAAAFVGVAMGRTALFMPYVDSWLLEGGRHGPATPRSQRQFRSVVQRFASWCEREHIPLVVEAITRQVAGRYASQDVADGVDPATTNKHVGGLSSFWSWMVKRAGVEGNPWQGQSRSLAGRKTKEPRPFTDAEMVALLTGDKNQELEDIILIGALSGMRLDEPYRLRVRDCTGGVFNVLDGKSKNGIRPVPIHSGLADLVARRCANKEGSAFLFHEAGPQRPGNRDRSGNMSTKFRWYRIKQGAHEKPDAQRQSVVDFHSFRRWFITQARNGGHDWATVSAVCGQRVGNLADDVYSSGPTMAMRIACVESVKLPG